jgi:hypothetical protein
MRAERLTQSAALLLGSLAMALPGVAQAGSLPDFYSSRRFVSPIPVARPGQSFHFFGAPAPMVRRTLAIPRPPTDGARLHVNPESEEPLAPGGSLSCVPFARAMSGIDVKGNAADWWGNAAGLYSRGSKPEVASVLNLRPTARMPLGHVAVVTSIVNSRVIKVDHANWAGSRGVVARGVSVIDVSISNDWSKVRVGLDQRGNGFGSTYVAYGFIYNRPDSGMASVSARPEPGMVRRGAAG